MKIVTLQPNGDFHRLVVEKELFDLLYFLGLFLFLREKLHTTRAQIGRIAHTPRAPLHPMLFNVESGPLIPEANAAKVLIESPYTPVINPIFSGKCLFNDCWDQHITNCNAYSK